MDATVPVTHPSSELGEVEVLPVGADTGVGLLRDSQSLRTGVPVELPHVQDML